MSVFSYLLNHPVGVSAVIVAIGTTRWNFARAKLLDQAGDVALTQGNKEQCRQAGLKIIDRLTSDDRPWFRALLWWRKSDGGPPRLPPPE
jgi:hypothetical protein